MDAYRVRQGQRLRLHTIASAASRIRAIAGVRYDDGRYGLLIVPETTVSSSRTEEDFFSSGVALANGIIDFCVIEPVTTTIKRGQLLARLSMGSASDGPVLCQDYVYQNHWVTLGEVRDSGPAGGDGWLNVITLKANGAPAASSTQALGASNTRSRYRGFTWYYNAAADAATRVLNVRLNNPTLALPTGFAAAGAPGDVWRAPALTLVASEEGTLYADRVRSLKNTNGTLAIDSQASAPTPFEYEAREDDTGDLIFEVTDGHANDRDVIYVIREEWLVL